MVVPTRPRPALESSGSHVANPLRLRYRLRTQSPLLWLLPVAPDSEELTLTSNELRAALPKLHALDRAIAQEITKGTVYGQIRPTDVARLMPLLAQRDVRFRQQRLVVDDDAPLTPRMRPDAEASRFQLRLGLSNLDHDWLDIDEGMLLVGPQAYFLHGATAYPIATKSATELAQWLAERGPAWHPEDTPAARDAVIKQLRRLGIPSADLDKLETQRQSPDRFSVHFEPIDGDNNQPRVQLHLLAYYGRNRAAVRPQRHTALYMPAPDVNAGLIARDLDAEEQAREKLVEAGFRFDRQADCYTATGDLALAALDANSDVFPTEWKVEQSGERPRFQRDLALRTEFEWQPDDGRIALMLGIDTVPDDGERAPTTTAAPKLNALLEWLRSGERYLKLADGSYVAPSTQFRRGLTALEHLGATRDRLLVSPLCLGLLKLLRDHSAVAVADQATEALIQEVTSDGGPKPYEPTPELAAHLRDYQRHGLNWLMMLHRYRLTGILADDMGLGKTRQALTLLRSVQHDEGPQISLVVTPTSVMQVWHDEASRFVPDMNVLVWHGQGRHEQSLDDIDVLVTSYGTLQRDVERLANLKFRYVILDEAQNAKNARTQNARAIRQLTSQRRLALTGTPVENRPEELWALFDFLAPGFLGSLKQFRTRYSRPIERREEHASAMLRARIGPLVLRRLKEDVATDLPPKTETVMRCDMDSEQRSLYETMVAEARDMVRAKIRDIGLAAARPHVLTALLRLRQVCCDPALLGAPAGIHVPDSAKLALFEELMREALDANRRILVFSQFVEMQKRLIACIKNLGVEPLWLHGGTRHRDRIISAFQAEDGPPVIVVSLRAGGSGITLSRADTVIHYDPWWNPAVENQATDRAHRLGQTQRVSVYRLICSDSIEERVLELAQRKAHLANALLGHDGDSGAKQINEDDLMALLDLPVH